MISEDIDMKGSPGTKRCRKTGYGIATSRTTDLSNVENILCALDLGRWMRLLRSRAAKNHAHNIAHNRRKRQRPCNYGEADTLVADGIYAESGYS